MIGPPAGKIQALRAGDDREDRLRERIGRGRSADLIVDEAKKWRADLIIMGTHAYGGLKHAVLGSAAEAVLHASDVPVLLVRARERKHKT